MSSQSPPPSTFIGFLNNHGISETVVINSIQFQNLLQNKASLTEAIAFVKRVGEETIETRFNFWPPCSSPLVLWYSRNSHSNPSADVIAAFNILKRTGGLEPCLMHAHPGMQLLLHPGPGSRHLLPGDQERVYYDCLLTELELRATKVEQGTVERSKYVCAKGCANCVESNTTSVATDFDLERHYYAVDIVDSMCEYMRNESTRGSTTDSNSFICRLLRLFHRISDDVVFPRLFGERFLRSAIEHKCVAVVALLVSFCPRMEMDP